MSPELITAIGVVLAAVLGPAGVSALRRRSDAAGATPSPATEVRDATPALFELSDALAEAGEEIRAVKARVAALEGSVWRCPKPACPVRDQLREESP